VRYSVSLFVCHFLLRFEISQDTAEVLFNSLNVFSTVLYGAYVYLLGFA